MRYSNGQEAVFDNQIAIRHAQPDPSKPAPFARLGDSGALVLYEGDQGLVAIGLLFAVTKAFAYATPLKPILDKFNIQLP